MATGVAPPVAPVPGSGEPPTGGDSPEGTPADPSGVTSTPAPVAENL
ncbi:hypothetical protein ABGB17_37825 [Sphaerisporangium sp. B11E5]